MSIDLSSLTDEELRELQDAVSRERAVRRELNASPEKIDKAIADYQAASGVEDGDPWTFPATALMRPMEGALRRHNGKLWRSTINHNVFEPGVSGWVLEPEIDPETGETIYPPFVRPSGAHDAYREGQRITGEDGNVYAANRDGVDWPPEVAPQDWDLVEPEPEPEPEEPPEEEEPEPDEGEPVDPDDGDEGNEDEDEESEPPEEEESEPEPEPEPGTLGNPFIWAAGDDYETDHYTIYNGTVYRVRQAHTSAAHWPPDAVASLYERQ